MRNEIEKMEGFLYLQNLRELDVSKNKIEKLEGIHFCQSLRILKINSQRIKNKLEIDQDSIIGISQTLT